MVNKTYGYARRKEYTLKLLSNNPWVTTQVVQDLIKNIEIGSTLVKGVYS